MWIEEKGWIKEEKEIMDNAGSSLMGIGTATGMYGNCNVASNSWSSIWFIIMQWLECEEALDPLFCLQKDV